MDHPNIIDKLLLKINPRYLYPNQLIQTASKLNVALVHKVFTPSHWKIMDYVTLNKGSALKFLGTGKNFKLTGDLLPTHSLFEIVDVTSERHMGAGDIVALTPSDRKFLTPAPANLVPSEHLPTYFTAENQ